MPCRPLGLPALALAVVSLGPAPAPPDVPRPGADEAVHLAGRVVTLADALASLGQSADPEPIALQVVLKGDDGTITPLLSDPASRALFRDARLRGRRTEVEGRRRRGSPYLQVLTFRVEEQGSLRTPEYYCEICKISVRFPQTCPCCQGAMELRWKGAGN